MMNRKHAARRTRQRSLLGSGILVLAALLLGCHAVERRPMGPRRSLERCARLLGHGVTDRTPRGCAECHAEVVHQWARSSHAAAWTDPAFVRATNDRQMTGCLSCHAPRPLLEQCPGEPPQLRGQLRDRGIDCNACHAVGQDYAGPYDTFGPHGMRNEVPRLRSSQFCATCHKSEVDEYASLYVPSRGLCNPPKSCAECHMPARKARLTQGHLLSLIHPKHVVRDHSFCSWHPALVQGAVALDELRLDRRDDAQYEAVVTLTNRGAGHNIPTGVFGQHEVRIVVEALDCDGQALAGNEQSIFANGPMSLAPDQPRVFQLPVAVPAGSQPVRLRLLVERVNNDRTFGVALARREISLTTSERR